MTEVSDWPCGWRPGQMLLRTGGIHDRCGWSWADHDKRPAGEPHHPNRWYLCDDLDCCWDGSPVLKCAVCSEEWPCATKREHVAERKARKDPSGD